MAGQRPPFGGRDGQPRGGSGGPALCATLIGMEIAVGIRGLQKSYGTSRVLAGIDLSIERGECFALLGPNGAGKTTTVDIVGGFRARDAGAVTVLGQDPARGDRQWRARVGVVSQTSGAALDLTVAEAVRHFRSYHGCPRDSDELIAAVGLETSADVRIPALSGGQRRRLDVALGIQGQAELLLLDEPTTGLDPAARRQFWSLVNGLRDAGTTILLTTHYLDEAAQLADRVAVLAGGRIVDVAAPAGLGAALDLPATLRWTDGRGMPQRLTTHTPTGALRSLLDDEAGEIADLTLERPTLEDVYLELLDRHALDAVDLVEVPA